MSGQRKYHCDVCVEARQAPVYCAPRKCLCGHLLCPAYPSYINPREQHVAPVTVRQSTNTTWAERDSPTWIDNL